MRILAKLNEVSLLFSLVRVLENMSADGCSLFAGMQHLWPSGILVRFGQYILHFGPIFEKVKSKADIDAQKVLTAFNAIALPLENFLRLIKETEATTYIKNKRLQQSPRHSSNCFYQNRIKSREWSCLVPQI